MAAVALLAARPAPAPGGPARKAGPLPAAGWRVRPHSLRSVPPPGVAGRGGARAARPTRAAMGGCDLFALDFDGVFCDSCGESSLSAVKAAKVRWPWVFERVDAAMEEWIVERMHTLRPVIETGYENLLLVRLLVEIQIPSVRKSSSRFAGALLKELAGVDFPSERIYGLGTGPKVKVLQRLQEMPQHQGLTLHFIEDRLATLKNVIKEPALDKWNLYLVKWGYNTQKEREEAGAISRIQLIDLPDFSKQLK
ncbi:uncharacterized protein LOC123411172 isoform X2 [Hordeum vulgare subsp. vulgare]|uniref:uncharacterized protein LOC123411172 isoform X2 n=1 Tax=Hordeum vulgare subsp. vulgare TaxID=112509 RepID=UPI001D1A3CB7|nr:uncharacterized protein LOC123411172 isoform X2 [Hordeum vulgare subsp. vulgare]